MKSQSTTTPIVRPATLKIGVIATIIAWVILGVALPCGALTGAECTSPSFESEVSADSSSSLSSDHSQPVQVYIMLGQSNMLGFGRVGPRVTVGSREYLVKERDKYPHLIDAEGDGVTRQDVRYVHVMDKRGVDYHKLDDFQVVRDEWLTPQGSFGPEVGFGHVIGDFHDQPVLVLKAFIGNRNLVWDLLPPGSERFQHDGKTMADLLKSETQNNRE